MKNLTLIVFLFAVVCCNAQTKKPIDGFLGVKFGTSKEQTTAILTARGGVLDKDFEKPGTSAFDNISLGNRKASYILVHYVNNQFYEGSFIFTPQLETQSIDFYNALANDLSEVYGTGTAQKIFKQPYKDGDGYEITAIKSGNAYYETTWRDGDREISLKITPDNGGPLVVRLYYDDEKLRAAATQQVKEKNKSDF